MVHEEDNIGTPEDVTSEITSEDTAEDNASGDVADREFASTTDDEVDLAGYTREEAAEDAEEDAIEDAEEDAAEDAEEGAVEDAEEDATEDVRESEDKRGLLFINPAYNKLLPATVLAALIGLLLGSIPAIAVTLILGKVFYPLFIVIPLLIYLFNKLLKGGRDGRALIVTIVFSLAGAYLTALACQATLYVLYYDISVLQIPVITALVINRPGVLPSSASSYAYPLIFTVLGIFIAAELFRGRENAESGMQDEELEDEDSENSESVMQDEELEDEDSQITNYKLQCTNGDDTQRSDDDKPQDDLDVN